MQLYDIYREHNGRKLLVSAYTERAAVIEFMSVVRDKVAATDYAIEWDQFFIEFDDPTDGNTVRLFAQPI